MGLIAQYHPHMIRVSDYLYDANISALSNRASSLTVTKAREHPENADNTAYACAYDVASNTIECLLMLKDIVNMSDDRLLTHVDLLINTVLPQVSGYVCIDIA